MTNLPKRTALIFAVRLPTGPQIPVGLGYVARALELARHPCLVLDVNLDSEETILCRLAAFSPQIVGITLWNFCASEAYRLLETIRRALPSVTLIAGGPEVTMEEGAVLEGCPAIDVGVVGEGCETILEILRGDELAGIPGIVYRSEGAIQQTERRAFVHPDSTPFPTYSDFELRRYGPRMSLVSSYGCPYRCIYCSVPRSKGQAWRPKSWEHMLEEVRFWYDRGYRSFQFHDSNLLLDRVRIGRFCEQVIDERLDCRFDARGVRADHLDIELLGLLRQAGFRTLRIGVESGSDRVLRALKKGETRQQIETAIREALDAGFELVLYFLIGSPGEGPEEIKASFELARKYPVRKVMFFALTPEPGTEFHDWAVSRGYWTHTRQAGCFKERPLMRTDVMSLEELERFHGFARLVELEVAQRYRRRQASANLPPARSPSA